MKRIKWEAGYSLSQIATEFTGSEENWQYIVKLNKIKIFEEPIEVGTTLQIPEVEDIKSLFPNTNELEKLIKDKSLPVKALNKISQFFYGGI